MVRYKVRALTGQAMVLYVAPLPGFDPDNSRLS